MSLFNAPSSFFQKILGIFESFTGFATVIDSDHNYIHASKAFTYPVTFSLASMAKKECIIQAPAAITGKYIHWRPSRLSTTKSAVKVELYESPTYTGGSVLTGTINRNRTSTIIASAVLIDGAVTVTDNGDLLDIISFGTSGNPSSVAGGGGGAENEIVMKPGLEYLNVVTNLTTTTTDVYMDLFWYEETIING